MAGGLQDLAIARANLLSIPPKNLIPDPENERADYGDIQELAADIAQKGLEHPLKVRLVEDGKNKKAMVVDGHRRLRAILYAIKELGAKIESVPCFSEARGTSEDQRVFDRLSSNEGQKPFTPLEEGTAYKKLIDMGVPENEIITRARKTKSYIRDRLQLLAAPRDVRQAVQDGRVSPGTAKTLATATPEKRKAVLSKAQPVKSRGNAVKVTAAQVRKEMGVSGPIFNRGRLREMMEEAKVRIQAGETNTKTVRWAAVKWTLEVVLGETEWKDW